MNILSRLVGSTAEKAGEKVVESVEKTQLLVVLAEGRRHLNELIDLGNEVASAEAADLITDVAFAMKAIYDDFEVDPRDVDVAHNFVTYHAPRAVELVTTYVRALAGGTLSDTDRARTETTLRAVIDTCRDFLVKCRENDSDGLEFQAASLQRLLEFQSPALTTKP